MLLGRTADGLYWMNRYIERVENMARLVDAGFRIALTRDQQSTEEWSSIVVSAGVQPAYSTRHKDYTATKVADFLLRDPDNASSVLAAMAAARTNARMVRTALTRETWESINEGWMGLRRILAAPVETSDLPHVLDAVKRATALIRGAFHGTMLRNEIFDFSQLGTFIERADNTARILDVKYYVLLPSVAWVGSSLDTTQWESILRSVSAHRSYRWVYGVEYRPNHIADFLILNGRMPRSLVFCYRSINESLRYLAEAYGVRHPCHDLAEGIRERLNVGSIRDIFDQGLHEFLSAFIVENNRLGAEIADNYRFYR
jgi:uncharacterized alpha-E superfamily protein